MYLEELFHDHYMAIRHLAPKAIACYKVSLRQFDRWLASRTDREPGKATLADFSDITIARFVSDRERETCRATAKRDRTQLLCLWRYACRCGWMTVWPNPTPLRVPERVPRAYKAEEIDSLIEYFGRIKGTVDGVPAGEWWSSLVTALWQCGTRITETISVEWSAVDLVRRTILFRAETRKGRTRDIVRDITPDLSTRLAARSRESGRVWRWDRNHTHLWYHFRDHCRAAGITYRGFHAIRKAALSYTKAAGGDAQKLGDHASAKTTEVYFDPDIVKTESNLARLPPLRNAKEPPPVEPTTPASPVVQPPEPPASEAPPRPASKPPIAKQAQAAVVRAGFEAGQAFAAAGLPRPSTEEVEAVASESGHHESFVWFRQGFWFGWGKTGDKAAG